MATTGKWQHYLDQISGIQTPELLGETFFRCPLEAEIGH